MRGGSRIGAGRPKGASNSKALALAKKAMDEGLTPLEYLLQVMRDESNERAARLDAAKAAAPYMHPRLSSVDVKNSDGSLKPEPVQDGVLGALARIHERG
jgi:hypothetical protein